jgi:predicted 3-demethylubiquinone-9 3-methyltransferase (glyoxalase superfamily)
MTNQIFLCLWFDGNAKAAADFYSSVFDNSKITADTPLVVTFELNGEKLMGLNGGPMFSINPSISLFVTCKSIEETNRIWKKLIEDGKTLMPIDKYPWSERYGWLQDKYGLTWQISVARSDADILKIMPSMLFTNKQFGRAEEAITFYNSVFNNSSNDMLIHYPAEDINVGKVMYSEFRINNYGIIAMDGPGVHDFSFNEAVSFVVNCETQSEIDYYWDKLTAGGQESMCGWLTDKFGVSWQIVPAIIADLMSEPAKAERIIKATLQMRKLDIEVLKNA